MDSPIYFCSRLCLLFHYKYYLRGQPMHVVMSLTFQAVYVKFTLSGLRFLFLFL